MQQGDDRDERRARTAAAYAAGWSKFWKRSSTNSVSGLGPADEPAGHDGDRAVLAERSGPGASTTP